jgi:putative tryptophan/tyrosine transport system substrate-binding protein
MSEFGGEPENIYSHGVFRILTQFGSRRAQKIFHLDPPRRLPSDELESYTPALRPRGFAMRRREFIVGLGGAASWPLVARAEKPTMPVIGFLSPMPSGERPAHAAFRQGLAEEGYVEGKNLAIEKRFTNFKPELMNEAAGDLVRLEVNVIFAGYPEAIAAARNATSSIPTVAVDLESDPVAMGYIKSLAHPGGNLTGMFLDLPELSGKQVGLLKEVVPGLAHVAIFGISGLNAAQFAAAAAAVQAVGVEAEIIEVEVPDDWGRALEAAKTRQVEAGILLSSPLVFIRSKQIGELALANRLPLISLFAEFPKAGGFIAYGPSVAAMWRRAGVYVGKILHGAKPNDLPIQRPEKFDLVINLKTAKALGLSVSSVLLATADEVID